MTTAVGMQREGVLLSDNKELQVREDGVFIRSLSQPDKNILLTYNRYLCSLAVITFCLYVHCVNLWWIIFCYVLCFSWACLRSYLHKIDVEARELNKKSRPVNYRVHIGHGIYVSVSDGYLCVDLRHFYVPYGLPEDDVRPTKRGIALCDWTNGRHSSTCCRSYMRQIHCWLTRNRVERTVTTQTKSACSTVVHAIRFVLQDGTELWLSRKQLRCWRFDVVVVVAC